MTQAQANKIFETNLGQQLSSIHVTSDDKVFIRREEAVQHSNNLENYRITEWFPEGKYPYFNTLSEEDAKFIYSLLPTWTKEAPEGLDHTMYGTLSKEGDDKIIERVKQILNL